MKGFNLSQLISAPTRISTTTSTLIDHIWSNNPEQFAHRGTLDTGISDDALNFTSRKRAKVSREKMKIHIRCQQNFVVEDFPRHLLAADWNAVYNSADVISAAENLTHIIVKLMDKHIPWKTNRTRIIPAPWIMAEYLSCIDRWDYRAKQCRRNPSAKNFELKRDAQRHVQHLKNMLKREYVETCLERHKHNPKKLWATIRQFWPNSKNKTSKIRNINEITNEVDIANMLNKHFCSVGVKVQEQINCQHSLDDFEHPYVPPPFLSFMMLVLM